MVLDCFEGASDGGAEGCRLRRRCWAMQGEAKGTAGWVQLRRRERLGNKRREEMEEGEEEEQRERKVSLIVKVRKVRS